MLEVSPGLATERMDEILLKPESQNLTSRLSSADAPLAVQQAKGLPVFGASLSHNSTRIGVFIAWFPPQPGISNHQQVFSLMWRHLQDLLNSGYELNSLSSEIVRNYEELSLLYNISKQLGPESDKAKILSIVAEHVQTILPASKVIIMLSLKSEGREGVVSHLAVDGEGNPLPPVWLEVGAGITGQVISSGQSKILGDVDRYPEFIKPSFPIKSLLIVPISMGDHVLGTLNVGDKAKGEEFTTYDLKLVSTIASEAAVALENARLFGEVKDLYLSGVKSLVMAIDAKDPYTHSHSIRVSELSAVTATEMDFDDRMVEDITLAALLHDVGKIGVPENVLLKHGKLTEKEWKLMKQHPLHSVHILDQVKAFDHLSKWVRHEHERYDGKGYPDGLKGDEIPIASRIIAVADAYDAITSDRHYRPRRSEDIAFRILKENAGTQFDPKIVDAFLSALQKDDPTKSNLLE